MKQTKRIVALMLAVMMLATIFTGCSPSSDGKTLKDGTYTGKGQGNNGTITVEMTVTNGKIAKVEIVDHKETPGIFEPAAERIPKQVVETQSVAVDVITGATKVSNGIIEAVKDCIKQAGGDLAKFEVAAQSTETKGKIIEKSTDVLVIGGGGSGLQSALRALSEGSSVILIEKNAALGGATTMNGSNIVATGSELSKSIFGDNGDSPELLYDDIKKGSKDTIKPELTQTMVNTIGKAIDWVSQTAGLKYQKAQTLVADHSVPRQVELPSSSSAELIKTVSEKFKSMGGEIMLDTRAEELTVKDGVVTGAVAKDIDGNTIKFTAKSVILATGGYGADKQYRTKDMEGYLYYGPSFSTGDGLEMAMKIGAAADNLDWYKIYPHGWEVEPGIGKLTTYSSKMATDMGGIYVNSKGERMLDESSVYSAFRDKIMEQEDSIAYLVMDQKTWDEFYKLLLLHGFTEELVQGYLKNNGSKAPVVVSSGSLEEAAKAAGIDAEKLVKTVKAYNGYCKAGKDAEFGKDKKFLDPIDEGTYYIVEQKVRFATTLGGLIVNPETMAVKDNDGKEIKNLYAAGEVIGGANGHDSLPSAMNTWNLASAFIAGEAAAKNAK